jgi:hypothetical protein
MAYRLEVKAEGSELHTLQNNSAIRNLQSELNSSRYLSFTASPDRKSVV